MPGPDDAGAPVGPALAEAIARAVLAEEPLAAVERISGPALAVLAKAVLDPDRRNANPSKETK